MGTSKPNRGPKGTPNPIPDWVSDSNSDGPSPAADSDNNDQEDNGDENGKDEEHSDNMNWSDVRRSFTAFTKETSKSNFKKFTSKYRKASGGIKSLAKSAQNGKKGAIILVDFLESISKKGFEETLEKYNIGDISSLNAEGSINKLTEIFIDLDGTDEGSAASYAAVETINKLYNDYTDNPDEINALDNNKISEYLEFYISKYIFERISIEITTALEEKDLSSNEVKGIETQIEYFIDAEVNLKFSESNFSNMNLKEKNRIINKIFEDAYSLI
ncbi:hypothetical protein [uncultured Maribacter sp.]|uniref:hypothetical protein n=1 Tax=uncultured Maribacter sp. TaxID=431308 RepID=UPI0030ED9417|tara:strand:- start:14411 stop:15229 length:819 start_codon:yes stop_codon:yes gene_type:complete